MLGIEEDGPDVYEGTHYLHALYPPPFLIPITFGIAGTQLQIPNENRVSKMLLLFREDSFDPTSRIKRGRIYRRDNTVPLYRNVFPHPARVTEALVSPATNGTTNRPLVLFHQHGILPNLNRKSSDQIIVALGTQATHSLWLAIDFELIHTGEELVTLRAIRSSGSFPTIKADLIPPDGKAKILQASEKLLTELNKATPESIIDRSREVMVAAIRCYLQSTGAICNGDDLGVLTKKLDELSSEKKKNIASNAGKIVALLHARGKTSEQERRPMRPVMEQDAELAVSCVGVTLCDFGWATWV